MLIERLWYKKNLQFLLIFLLPFSFVFGMCVAVRKFLYKHKILSVYQSPLPVIVVGNITVGGTGKTPFVIWLALELKNLGYQPGIICRSFGLQKFLKPHFVKAVDSATEVGDEAVLLFNQTGCSVVVTSNKVAGAKKLLHGECDIIICDDGLQHYKLARNLEIVLIDTSREFGNGYLLPAGPLRELPNRLEEVDFIIRNGAADGMVLSADRIISINDKKKSYSAADFPYKNIHAVAGIGNPQRFFQTLAELGFQFHAHSFPDHYLYKKNDIDFKDGLPVVMTEKDAVKCAEFVNPNYWYLSITANIQVDLKQNIIAKIKQIKANQYESFSEHDNHFFSN